MELVLNTAYQNHRDLGKLAMWRRLRAHLFRHAALVVLRREHTPGIIYDAVLPPAQSYQIETEA